MAAVKRAGVVTSAPATTRDLDQTCIDTIRTLCIDAIEAANSGHPGTPIGIAPVTYTLWQRFLRFDPADPIWPNRDRFVLSAGHASALLWSLLHLTGVRAVDPEYEILGEPAVSLDDLKRFRQLGSKCPGHPEYRWTSGVETTTGPLGQGVATSVGMAVASQWLGARYNRDGFALFDFDVYAQAGDGCMMEGVASEAASFAAPPAPLESLLDLRLEPGHDRRAHGARVHRGRRGPLHGVRLERRDSRGRERPRAGRAGVSRLQGRRRAADADRRRTVTSATALPSRTRRRRTASRSARRVSGPRSASTAGRRTPSSSSLTASASTSPRGSARAARKLARTGRRCSTSTARRTRTWRTRSSACSAASFPTPGTWRFRSSLPMRRASRAATRRVRC